MPSRTAAEPTPSMRSISRASYGYDEARHLLLRAGFGGTPTQIRTLADWGPDAAIDFLLDGGGAPYERGHEFRGDIVREPTQAERLEFRRAQQAGDEETIARFRRRRQEMQRADRRQIAEMQRWWLARMIETPAPLHEKMTLFWHGHFATGYRTIENSFHMYLQNEFFRRNALGNFGELLFGIVRDPAMLAYLDNNDSRAGRPNENLARELMELFSLGVGEYSEKDIQEGARALTGYTFEGNEFVFQQAWHDDGPKQILGKRGALDGDGFVTAILETRACSLFIAHKLYRFFVADTPDNLSDASRSVQSAVRRIASTLLASRYELRPVLRQLFLSEHFYDPANAASQIKSPVELVVGSVRSFGAPPRDLGALIEALRLMGQELFFPPSVAGWSGGRSWINTSTVFVRQNILVFLLTGRAPGGFSPVTQADRYDPTPLLGDLAEASPGAERDPRRVAEYLLRVALGPQLGAPDAPPGAVRLSSLLELVESAGGRVTPDVVTGMLTIITAMPEYQLC